MTELKRRPLIVLDVVGLTRSLVHKTLTPHLFELARTGVAAPVECPFPAVTLTSQASFLTGQTPSVHGIVGNGWLFRDLLEPMLWRQPHALVQCEDLPTQLRREDAAFRVAKLFWWFNMYAPVDFAVTPRPMYPADGRKVPDIHTYPSSLRDELNARHGPFPLFRFWGPAADLTSSDWITRSSLDVIERHRPDLSLVYLPHLDYDFQRFGPRDPRSQAALTEVDALVGRFVHTAKTLDARVLVISEYGIEPVDRAIHPNRALRDAGLLSIRMEEGLERLDCGASAAFALADHQIAHVYVRDHERIPEIAALLSQLPGVEAALTKEALSEVGLAHERSGEIVLVAEKGAWFTYYFWHDDALAPDYARTVDIHRKPGYDPAELHLDPTLKFPKLKIARRLLAKKLGFRNLLDVIGLDASVVKGSHGRRTTDPEEGPVLILQDPLDGISEDRLVPLSSVKDILRRSLGAR